MSMDYIFHDLKLTADYQTQDSYVILEFALPHNPRVVVPDQDLAGKVGYLSHVTGFDDDLDAEATCFGEKDFRSMTVFRGGAERRFLLSRGAKFERSDIVYGVQRELLEELTAAYGLDSFTGLEGRHLVTVYDPETATPQGLMALDVKLREGGRRVGQDKED